MGIRCITYNYVLRELDCLKLKLDKYRNKIESCRYNIANSKFRIIKWLYNLDLEDYNAIYSNYLYRYKIVQNIKNNFYKFITGITYSDFINTKKLADLYDKLKLVEMVEDLKINLNDTICSLKDLKIKVSSVNKNN